MPLYPLENKDALEVVEKKIEQKNPTVQEQLGTLIDKYKAGSPTDPTVYWIHLKAKELSALFLDQHQVKLSHGFIKRELRNLGYRYRIVIEKSVKV